MVFRNNYKGHMDKIKGGWNQGREVGMAGVGGVVGGKCRQQYLNTNKIIFKNNKIKKFCGHILPLFKSVLLARQSGCVPSV